MRWAALAIYLLATPVWASASRSFDGTDDQISMGNVLTVTTGDVSICIWTKTTEDATGDWLIGKRLNGNANIAGYTLRQQSTDLTIFRVGDGILGDESIYTTDNDGVWSWMCATWDGANNITTVYYNSVQEDTDTNVVVSLTETNNFLIGESGAGSDDLLGVEAYGHQYNAVLQLVSIQELQWKPCSIPGSMGGCWPLWGDSPEVDLSGAGLTGTVANATTSSDGPPVMVGYGPY